jgi:hypothetical protein
MRTKLGELLYRQAAVRPWDRGPDPDGLRMAARAPEGGESDEVGQALFPGVEPGFPAAVGREEQSALWEETRELYKVVPDLLSGDESQGRALRLLQEAQDIMLAKPRQFDVAKFKVGQVQALVTWRRNVDRWSRTYGWGIFAYLVVWILALLLGLVAAEPAANLVTGMVRGVPGIDGLSRLCSTMMWGGLGGVMGAFYSLYWHVSRVRDFDKKYLMWYVLQPVIGWLLGALVYLLLGPGWLSAPGASQRNQTAIRSLFPYAVACLVGFRQRLVLETIDRVIQVMTPSPRPHKSQVQDTGVKEPRDAKR